MYAPESRKGRFLLSKALFGLGGSYRGCHGHPGQHAAEPEEHSVPVHVHHAGVLPVAAQAVHCVADAPSHPQHAPTLPIRTQVS